MAVLIEGAKKLPPVKDVTISYQTGELIRRIYKTLGMVDAMRTIRAITDCSLLDAKQFIEQFCMDKQQ